jgi:RHS repeat-associated protein
MQSRGTTIGWTSYNYPDSVGTASETATFDYGPNRQRWRMVYTNSSGTETTYYATRKFEEVISGGVTDYRHYIYVGNRPVVVISRTSAGAINVHSLLLDHQGSVSHIITDATGVTDVGESFTAYGNRREASTWSGAPTSAELTTMNGVTREGYTFQTVLGSMGLNHMNGRIEDSVTGRFLSPDPRTPSRYNTQSYNRYSYANNNPLSYIDPTGFDEFTADYSTSGTTRGIGSDGGIGFGDIGLGNFDMGDGDLPLDDPSPSDQNGVPNNPCGCGDKGQQAIDDLDNYQDALKNGDTNAALNDFLRYYRDIGQPLNPEDYGTPAPKPDPEPAP